MRYLPHTNKIREEMLSKIGVKGIEELFSDIPERHYLNDSLDIPEHKSEIEVERELRNLSEKNITVTHASNFIGAGAYFHHVPAAVDHIIQRSEFLTSYTPYQPEVSQGTLHYLFEFQTQISLLTGMEVANASMYDGATACAEAILMSQRLNNKKKIIYSGKLHPHYLETAKTYTKFNESQNIFLSIDINDCEENFSDYIDKETSCVVVQNPDFFGNVKDFTNLSKVCRENGALLIIVITEIVSLGVLKSPGSMGADIVVGEGQSIGNSLNFGGPYVGFFATKKKYVRQMPGRIVGQTSDNLGSRGYVLTLSTREQHIRRDKATSNICTNSGLCSLAFTIHMSLLGENGLKKLSRLNHIKAVNLYERIKSINGVSLLNKNFFNEFSILLPFPAQDLVENLLSKKILCGVPLSRFYPDRKEFSNVLITAVTEMVQDNEINNFVRAIEEELR